MPKSRTIKVLILSTGQMLTTFVAIGSGIILTRILSVTDYGTYRQVMLAFSFAAPFAILGFDRALFIFVPAETTRSKGILFENLSVLLFGGCLLTGFILIGGNRLLALRFNNALLAPLLSMMAFYPIVKFMCASLPACLLVRERTAQLSIFNVVQALILFISVIVPTWISPHTSSALIGAMIGTTVNTTAALYLMNKACPDGDWKPTWTGIKSQAVFSIPLGLSSIIGFASLTLDQILVSSRCSTEVFAVYSVGAMEIPLLGMITGAITSVVIIDYARFYREADYRAIVSLMHQAMSKSAILIFPIGIFLFCMAPELMRILFGKSYEQSAVPFRIYLLMLPIRTLSFGAILQATGNSRHIFYLSILELGLNAIVGWTFIGWWGAAAAAWGNIITTYCVAVPYWIIIFKRITTIKIIDLFPWEAIGRVLILALATSVIPALIKQYGTLSDLPLIIVAASTYFPIILLLFVRANFIHFNEIRDFMESLSVSANKS
jgi:O-antigen/teichoic acid export membrane protein